MLALSDEKTIAELSSEFGVHQTQIHRWVKQVKESVAGIFSGEIKTEEAKKEKDKLRNRYFLSTNGDHLTRTCCFMAFLRLGW